MSGLYNMIMGRNPFIPYVLACLDITEDTLGRFRDVGVSEDGKRIFVLTRNYGDEWASVDDAMSVHPNFIEKVFESDETYSTYHFSVPPQVAEVVQKISEVCDKGNPFERYLKAIKDFSEGKKNEQTQYMKEAGKKIFEPLMKVIEGGSVDEIIEHGDGSVRVFSSPKVK